MIIVTYCPIAFLFFINVYNGCIFETLRNDFAVHVAWNSSVSFEAITTPQLLYISTGIASGLGDYLHDSRWMYLITNCSEGIKAKVSFTSTCGTGEISSSLISDSLLKMLLKHSSHCSLNFYLWCEEPSGIDIRLVVKILNAVVHILF